MPAVTPTRLSDIIKLTPRQNDFFRATRDHTYTLFGGAAGGGKALALETPIPTSTGWTTMADITAGSTVYDEHGVPCRVTTVFPIQHNRPVFAVTFDDGTVIEADQEHEWLTFSLAERSALLRRSDAFRERRREQRPSRGTGKRPDLAGRNAVLTPERLDPPTGTLRTTGELLATLRVRDRVNHAIPIASPLDMPTADLPIDPYLLGMWLGDGTGVTGVITTADTEVIDHIHRSVTKVPSAKYAYRVAGLTVQLRALGVLGNKHIPTAYLRASIAQRLALLQGLMDSDGYAKPDGACEFTATHRLLAEQTRELVLTLGGKCGFSEGRAMLYGRDCGPKYRLTFRLALPAFRLARKAISQKPPELRGPATWRYIVDVSPLPSKPVRCIEVDSPSHLYLAGTSFVPTHNSYSLRWWCVAFLLEMAAKGFNHVRVGLFCETYGALADRHIDRLSVELPPWLGKYNDTKREFKLAPEYGSGAIWFRNLDDPSKYQSVEFAAIAVDELTKSTEQTFWDLTHRLRWPDFEDTRFVAATNPGSVGHLWVRRLWIDRNYDDTDFSPDEFAFIPSKATDNPHISKSYLRKLDLLPERMRAALRDGSWDIFEGQFFSEWSPSRHVVDQHELWLPPEWERGVAIDWGFNDPYAVLWGAQDPSNGRLYFYRELYDRQVSEPEQARRIAIAGAMERRRFAVCDPAMFSKRGAQTPSVADVYAEHGVTVTPANNDRIGGWQLVRQALMPLEDGKPGLIVSNACGNLIRTLPALVYDDRRPEDCNTRGEDHMADSARYLVSAFKGIGRSSASLTKDVKRRRPQFTRSISW